MLDVELLQAISKRVHCGTSAQPRSSSLLGSTQIVDTDTPERIGGRLFTHRFSNNPCDNYVRRGHTHRHPVLTFM